MPKKARRPSAAWLDEIFGSPPRRDIPAICKTTTRVPVGVPLLSTVMWGEGGNEATALIILKHLHQHGLVKRFKAQALYLDEIGGPRGRVPDIFVETNFEPSLHIIQCKTKRYLIPEVQEKFDEEKAFLEPRGFQFHIWTDRDKLSNPTSQSVRLLDRGFQNPLTHERLAEIESKAAQARVLGELLDLYGWDDVMAAAAHGVFFFNLTEKIHEQTPLLLHFPRQKYELLFARRSIPGRFWDSLTT